MYAWKIADRWSAILLQVCKPVSGAQKVTRKCCIMHMFRLSQSGVTNTRDRVTQTFGLLLKCWITKLFQYTPPTSPMGKSADKNRFLSIYISIFKPHRKNPYINYVWIGKKSKICLNTPIQMFGYKKRPEVDRVAHQKWVPAVIS